jgi:hypothetical protein
MKTFTRRARTDLRMRIAVFVRIQVLQTSIQIMGEPQSLSGMISRKTVLQEVETRQFSVQCVTIQIFFEQAEYGFFL